MSKIFILMIAVFSFSLHSSDLKVLSAAGYKKPMTGIVKNYRDSKKDIDIMFGNMKKTVAQAENSDACVVVGDKEYLEKKSDLDIKRYIKLGEGKLVLAFAKGVDIKSIDDLSSQNIKKIAMPHPKKAIYGNAAKEFLQHAKNKTDIEKKLYIVATVPQVATYLVSKEVDAGFMNLTAALNHKEKIGGYIIVDENLYSPIEIVAASLNKQNCESAEPFLEFLQEENSKKIFKRYGL